MATTTQIVSETPEIEAKKLALMDAAKALLEQDRGDLPDYELAGLSQLQKDALSQLASGGLGDFAGLLDEAAQSYRDAGSGIGEGDLDQYLNPFTDEVILRTQDDIARQRAALNPELMQSAGSFGQEGMSRDFLQRGLADQEAIRTSAGLTGELRRGAFDNAVTNLENQRRRQALTGQGLGSIAEALPALTQQELGFMFDVGAQEQAQEQAELDTDRKNLTQTYFRPYEDLAFLSDIYTGAPSSTQTATFGGSAYQPSAAEQLFGYGLSGLSAASGAKNLGLFG
tara:strand:- start:692 stop:1543 length:852 start_codon:yes stop_codon:yes gene_type:complete